MLLIHADSIAFEAKSPAVKAPSALTDANRKGGATEALVVFYSVEDGDGDDIDALVGMAAQSIGGVQAQIKAERLVLYPYAHLSNKLAKPDVAEEVGKRLETAAGKLGLPVISAPFGYYKAFNLKAKGHPLAELSRTISLNTSEGKVLTQKPLQKESEALTKEKMLKSHWHVLAPDGKLTDAAAYDMNVDKAFGAFFAYETSGARSQGDEPPHVRMMREYELVDYEPGSDSGNFRWYPKGQLMKRLLEERCSAMVSELGGMRVETPIMYDYEHPALKKYLDRFPARQYVLESDEKDYFLRFAACFGQYLIFHDMMIGERDLPARLYELTHYSFRREQSGELSGLRRLRTFTMPDMHTLVADMKQAKDEYLRQFKACKMWMDELGVPFQVAIRFTREFFEEEREFANELVRVVGRPLLLEIWEERFFYFVMKAEFHPLDTQGKAAALSTVQIDVENAERFGIHYAHSDGTKKTPMLLHASISGAIERNVYAILENEARKMARGEKGSWPFWLAPSQVRIIPVTHAFNDKALTVADELSRMTGARVDVDEREETVGKRIREAEMEWLPYVVVYGEKEASGSKLSVRKRGCEQAETTLTEFALEISREQGERPHMGLPLPVRLSQRPIFRG